MTESAASIKSGAPRAHRIPALGTKLRGFYDSLHRTAEMGGFVPRMAGDDMAKRNVQITQLTLFYGMEIATIKRSKRGLKRGAETVVGWRLKGQHVGRDFYEYRSPQEARA